MKPQWMKDLFHGTMGELSLLNKWRLGILGSSRLASSRKDAQLWVHLGCGQHYAEGMVNVDVNPFVRSDVWLDLRKGLPFADGSVDAIYCCHTLEHFHEWDVRGILRECLRILKPGKGIRIVTPDLQKSVEAYLRGDREFFSGFPDKRESMGGKLANHLLCRDQHRLVFDFGFWSEILKSEGFEPVRECSPHRSEIFPAAELPIFEYEKPERHHSVFVEAFRPCA